MKKFKTIATDKKTGEKICIVSEYPTKTNFIKDIRANGYRVNPIRVAEEKNYDYIMDHTNATDNDFKKYKKVNTYI